VLYRAFDSFSAIGVENIICQDVVACLASFAVILFCSPLIGFVFGLSAGLMSRFTSHDSVTEPLIVLMFGYISFLSAEMFHLSGILSYVLTFDIVIFLFKRHMLIIYLAALTVMTAGEVSIFDCLCNFVIDICNTVTL